MRGPESAYSIVHFLHALSGQFQIRDRRLLRFLMSPCSSTTVLPRVVNRVRAMPCAAKDGSPYKGVLHLGAVQWFVECCLAA